MSKKTASAEADKQNLVVELTEMGMEIEQHEHDILDNKLFLLHRALTIGESNDSHINLRIEKEDPLWDADQRQQLREKYFTMLMSL